MGKINQYVCPFCWEQINNCKCEYIPYTLIHIDCLMQYAIRKLNSKELKTFGCCEGHYKKNKIVNIFIDFKEDSRIVNCPKNWKREKGNIHYTFKPKSKKEFLEIQKQAIENLNKWIDEIVNLN